MTRWVRMITFHKTMSSVMEKVSMKAILLRLKRVTAIKKVLRRFHQMRHRRKRQKRKLSFKRTTMRKMRISKKTWLMKKRKWSKILKRKASKKWKSQKKKLLKKKEKKRWRKMRPLRMNNSLRRRKLIRDILHSLL